MNSEIKKMWVEALRSGKYKQAKQNLKTADSKFCCLGVLCELHRKNCEKPDKWKSQWQRFYYANQGNYIPLTVRQWAEIVTSNPETSLGPLAYLNDLGYTFEQIADIIEKEL